MRTVRLHVFTRICGVLCVRRGGRGVGWGGVGEKRGRGVCARGRGVREGGGKRKRHTACALRWTAWRGNVSVNGSLGTATLYQCPLPYPHAMATPAGRVWTMVAGGGASVAYADTISDMGFGHELANYGEYSGAPSRDMTYEYAKTILSLMGQVRAVCLFLPVCLCPNELCCVCAVFVLYVPLVGGGGERERAWSGGLRPPTSTGALGTKHRRVRGALRCVVGHRTVHHSVIFGSFVCGPNATTPLAPGMPRRRLRTPRCSSSAVALRTSRTSRPPSTASSMLCATTWPPCTSTRSASGCGVVAPTARCVDVCVVGPFVRSLMCLPQSGKKLYPRLLHSCSHALSSILLFCYVRASPFSPCGAPRMVTLFPSLLCESSLRWACTFLLDGCWQWCQVPGVGRGGYTFPDRDSTYL